MLVAGVIGEGEQVLGGDLWPQRLAGVLHVVAQFPVVQAQAIFVVHLGRLAVFAVQALAEQAVQLVDGAFVQALFLHDLVDHGDVQRHHRNRRAGLGDHRLEHRHVGSAAVLAQARIQALRGVVQIHLGLAQCAVPVDRPGDLGADIAEGHAARAIGEHAGAFQRVDPQFPILPAHHGDGVFDLLLCRRLDRGLDDGVLVGVDGGGGVGVADRLERRALHFAAARQLAHRRGQRIHHQVDLAAHLAFDQLDHLRTRGIGERIAIDRLAVQTRSLGMLVEGGRVVPAGGTGLGGCAGLFEEHAQRVGAESEGSGDARSQAVAAGRADHQHLLRAVATHAMRARGGDLLEHIALAAKRMRGGADEAAHFGMDDQRGLLVSKMLAAS
ncbi:hypothetical protein XHV734_0152 [Xanthomonas hortorum pv. vitians]|nr:hypothetical protein XHV734_0152 [Xanthomonas hortorum pv. vitians]